MGVTGASSGQQWEVGVLRNCALTTAPYNTNLHSHIIEQFLFIVDYFNVVFSSWWLSSPFLPVWLCKLYWYNEESSKCTSNQSVIGLFIFRIFFQLWPIVSFNMIYRFVSCLSIYIQATTCTLRPPVLAQRGTKHGLWVLSSNQRMEDVSNSGTTCMAQPLAPWMLFCFKTALVHHPSGVCLLTKATCGELLKPLLTVLLTSV